MVVWDIGKRRELSNRLARNMVAHTVPWFRNFVFTKVALDICLVEWIKQLVVLLVTASMIKIVTERHIDTTAIDMSWRRVTDDMSSAEGCLDFAITIDTSWHYWVHMSHYTAFAGRHKQYAMIRI